MVQIGRFGEQGNEQPCIVVGDSVATATRYDASNYIEAFTHFDMTALAAVDVASLPVVPTDVRWGAPIPRPGKIICIGLNYADHAEESGLPIPEEPIVFMKAPNTVIGPFDQVEIPRASHHCDWEVELAIVIGKTARYLESETAAAAYIAGYTICNDVSERHFQLERGGQWDKGKSCDTFCPLGPWLKSTSDMTDVAQLSMYLDVNGERCQTGSTATMIFKPYFIVHYLSQFMTLEPGDVVSTGTPPGVGLGMKPPRYLQVGDQMELGIDGLGMQRQSCIAAR